jgi:glycosyltransferase involved in cell wall biosynthesis
MTREPRAFARTRAVGVVLPVHNEQELLGSALASLADAFDQLSHGELAMRAVVVLDACSDASEEITLQWQSTLARRRCPLEITVVRSSAKNVGHARALGCASLLAQWSRTDPSRIWLATTDADSRVPTDWLATQVIRHETGVDHWSGRVSVDDWSGHHDETRLRWQNEYEREIQPIHGANLGFNAAAYLEAGGFATLETGEDRALHRALIAHGALSYFDSAVRVVTSARRRARAPLGFAHALEVIGSTPRVRATS